MPRRLGQHFLTNRSALLSIVEALEIRRDDWIFEIGPGHGEMTSLIAEKNSGGRIIAIEKDEELARELRARFQHTHIEIISGDALKLLPELPARYGLKNGDYKITGNIPYYITGYLLRTVGELAAKPSRAVLTIQREVADRILSAPPRMNLLAASIQFWAEPYRIQDIPARDFSPPPRVDSATIMLRTRSAPTTADPERYYHFIKALFQHPRKTVANNLREYKKYSREVMTQTLATVSLRGNERPQNIPFDILVTLANIL